MKSRCNIITIDWIIEESTMVHVLLGLVSNNR